MPDSRILDGISRVDMACSFTVELDRTVMNWDTLATYMDAVSQIVPSFASVSFSDKGDSIILQFVWAETREAKYNLESEKIAIEPPSQEPTGEGEQPQKPRRAVAGLPRR